MEIIGDIIRCSEVVSKLIQRTNEDMMTSELDLVIVGVRQFEHFLLLTSLDNAPSDQARVCHRNMSRTFLFACVAIHCNLMSHTGIASLRKGIYLYKIKILHSQKFPTVFTKIMLNSKVEVFFSSKMVFN